MALLSEVSTHQNGSPSNLLIYCTSGDKPLIKYHTVFESGTQGSIVLKPPGDLIQLVHPSGGESLKSTIFSTFFNSKVL